MNVWYESYTSDHMLVYIEILLVLVPHVDGTSNNEFQKIKCCQFSGRCIEDYANATMDNLANVIIPLDAIICNDVNCTNDAHISYINVLHDDLIEVISSASDNMISRQGNKARSYKCRPGWNDYTRDLHTAAR